MGKNASYTAAFKLKAIEYAIEHGNRAAGRHFGVTDFNVRYWSRARTYDDEIGRAPESKGGNFMIADRRETVYVVNNKIKRNSCCWQH